MWELTSLCLFSNLGQDIYLYPLHALWGVWEDHHGRWSHRVFPEILPRHHTTNRSVCDFLTSLSLSPHRRLSSPSPPSLSPSVFIFFIQPAEPFSRSTLFSHHPVDSGTQSAMSLGHDPRSVKLQTYSYTALCGEVLIWGEAYVVGDGEIAEAKHLSLSCTHFLSGSTLFGVLGPKQLHACFLSSVWLFNFTRPDRAWLF